MSLGPQALLVVAVAAVGVLHTLVPDHWAPIALLARQLGWSKAETAQAALQAGIGHVLTTLALALVVWGAGLALAARFGHLVDALSGIALVAFGGWIAVAAWRDLRAPDGTAHRHHAYHHTHLGHGHGHSHDEHHHPGENARAHDCEASPAIAADPLYLPLRSSTAGLLTHVHLHRHGGGAPHLHWHDHAPATWHAVTAALAAAPPLHDHRHKTTGRTALLLILGSSPMVEGIPAFFAAAKYGAGLIAAMAAVFAASTIATYVLLCVGSAAGLHRLRLGAFERYGEMASGAFIAVVGLAFGLPSVM
ncbi:MAG TPA: hypothetical protein VKY65_02260 [Alphaproteobacteria bacterium]|nr:hypothetical protein [Alphaproteobacteria bacterium]